MPTASNRLANLPTASDKLANLPSTSDGLAWVWGGGAQQPAMMRRLILFPFASLRAGLVPALLGLLLVASAPASAQRYVPGTEDVPLMPGLSLRADTLTSFDSARGRVVSIYGSGRLQGAQVLEFYRRSLPQLGWDAVTTRLFRREGEQLSIDVEERSGGVAVHFLLVPAN